MLPGALMEHSKYWYAEVENIKTGKRRTYYLGGNSPSRETVGAFIAEHYRGVKVISLTPTDVPPSRIVRPIPPQDYEFGHRVAVEKHLNEQREQEERARYRGIQPLRLKPLKPLDLKPLSI